MIDLARGHPNESLLPKDEMKELLTNVSEQEEPLNGLGYGDEAGNPGFLAELAAFLERRCAEDDLGTMKGGATAGKEHDIAPTSDAPSTIGQRETTTANTNHTNTLFATTGVSHGLELICATQTKPGDVVLVERPTYFLIKGILLDHGLRIRGLPMKNTGGSVNVDRLVEDWDSNPGDFPRLVYLIPSNGNPTGHTMPIEDRIMLTRAAIRHGVLVVADDVYHLLDWRPRNSPRPARMSVLSAIASQQESHDTASTGGCVSVSSFTKIFAPGIRCGWIEGAPQIIDALVNRGYIQSQGGCGPWVGEIMRVALVRRVADAVLERLCRQYQARANRLCEALSDEPRIKVINQPIGGYFLWIQFPNINSNQFLEYCMDRGVAFLPGTKCDVGSNNDGLFQSHARLCFADLDEEVLDVGVKRLVSCFREYEMESRI